ncbi:MAG: TolC family protein [Sedimentisphaerales bacterium]|nr:TolC family protein [Sedimentisphaerales bacterium]
MTKALASRDDLLAARAQLQAQARTLESVRATRWPQLFLQGSYGARWAAGHTMGTTSELDDIGRIGVGLEMLIFDGGVVDAKIKEQVAKLVAARHRLRKLELKIQVDVQTAIRNILAAQERTRAVQASVEQAAEGLSIERERYELGKGAILDVLDAQSALLDAQTNYYKALADLHLAIAQFKLATGEQ